MARHGLTERIAVRSAAGLAAVAALWGVGSFPPRPRVEAKEVEAQSAIPVRDVRVRLAARVARVRVRCDSTIYVSDATRSANLTLKPDQWHVFAPQNHGELRCDGRSLATPRMTFQSVGTHPITFSVERDSGWTPGHRFVGRFEVSRRDDGRIDVIHSVEVERYIASVVASEVWPTFETEAYRAQAIVARSYVLYTMNRRHSSDFDVEAGQGSQVYRGVRTDEVGRRATEAARYTRGIVSAWREDGRDRLFSAFYSAACGGMSQSGAMFGDDHDIQPLSGGVACNYCKDAPGETYRWGPVRIEKNEVRRRLASRFKNLKSLGSISKIRVIERTPQGRPLRLEITDSSGRSHKLLGESFRIAVGADRMRSTNCTIRVSGKTIEFSDGRGFGHGIGLCQWGAQGLAKRGRYAAEILRFYYPGSTLVRVY